MVRARARVRVRAMVRARVRVRVRVINKVRFSASYLSEELAELPELPELVGGVLLEVELGEPAQRVHVHLQRPRDPVNPGYSIVLEEADGLHPEVEGGGVLGPREVELLTGGEDGGRGGSLVVVLPALRDPNPVGTGDEKSGI